MGVREWLQVYDGGDGSARGTSGGAVAGNHIQTDGGFEVSALANRHGRLIGYVLGKAEGEPLRVRVDLYLALAEVCPGSRERLRLRKMARDLEAAERRCQEFVFEFKKQNEQ